MPPSSSDASETSATPPPPAGSPLFLRGVRRSSQPRPQRLGRSCWPPPQPPPLRTKIGIVAAAGGGRDEEFQVVVARCRADEAAGRGWVVVVGVLVEGFAVVGRGVRGYVDD